MTEEEVVRLRRLGATKIQIGYQSLDDEVLSLNERGHDVLASRRATKLLRRAGFKIQAHWMANLYGSSPERDLADYERLFSDSDFRPDELKLYPCSLIESATLMTHYEAGRYRPYSEATLLELLVEAMTRTPPYCRLSRVIRDIPGEDILAGSRVTNFRAVAEEEMRRRGVRSRDIRAREVRSSDVSIEDLRRDILRYRTSSGEESFLSYVTEDDRLAGFLRLALPDEPSFIDELGDSAIVREVHVYGSSMAIGAREEGKAQHAGLGRKLLQDAAVEARSKGFARLSVISSVGTPGVLPPPGLYRRAAVSAPVFSMTMQKFLASALLAFFSCRRAPSDWEKTKSWVRSEFPGVDHVSAEELRRSLSLESNRKTPILLDVRTAEEYEVSHLPGAIRVDPESDLPDFLKTLDHEAPVVAYCSVGYRSSRLVERLEREGFQNAKNLEGSIFEWANKGYPVERDGTPVEEVHPYDAEWGRLLDPSLHAYQPR